MAWWLSAVRYSWGYLHMGWLGAGEAGRWQAGVNSSRLGSQWCDACIRLWLSAKQEQRMELSNLSDGSAAWYACQLSLMMMEEEGVAAH
jgi:hypothetical protein